MPKYCHAETFLIKLAHDPTLIDKNLTADRLVSETARTQEITFALDDPVTAL